MSNTTKITLHNEAVVSAHGRKRNTNAKPVFCIDTGEVYASSLDAAEQIGVSPSTLSWALTGRQKTCKGKRYCLVSKIPEYLEEITIAMQTRDMKVRAYDEMIYHQQAIDEAIAKLEKDKATREKLKRQLEAIEQDIIATEKELEELKEG
jgi:hypothetical protein